MPWQGNWSEARDLYAQAMDEGTPFWRVAEFSSPGRALAVQMGLAFMKTGDHANHERLSRFLVALAPSVLDAQWYSKIICANAANLPPDLFQCGMEMARYAMDNVDPAAPEWTSLSCGLASYYEGNYEQAIEWLLKAEPSDDVGCSGGAKVYRAMSLRRLGRSEEAVRLLFETEQMLGENLVNRTGSSWWDLEILQLAREEAHQLMAPELAVLNAKWQPVVQLLDDGFKLAQQRRWTEARDAYVRALEDPAFEWSLAERASPERCLSMQMGAALVKAGDSAAHQQLCEVLFEAQAANPSMMNAERYAKTSFLNATTLPAEMLARALELARTAGAVRGRMRMTEWACQVAGIAEYHAGNFERAVELFMQAELLSHPGCKGSSMAYRAMALKQLGRDKEAAEVLEAAEEMLAGFIRRRLSVSWWDLDFSELALAEARRLIGRSPMPRSISNRP